jgi:hypothetical protein
MEKKSYQVRNWRHYNESLVQRGSITFWLDEKAIHHWESQERTGRRGRPYTYSDMALVCGLTLKAVFKLTFRSTQGFIRSLAECLGLRIKVPDYTLLCKRQKNLTVDLPTSRQRQEGLHLVVDSSGLKVYGEGEWKVRQQGWVKHRLWRKLHIGINSETQEIEVFELSDLGVQDCQGLECLLGKLKKPISTVIGDGSYDRFCCYEAAERRQFKLLTPPQRNAKTSKETKSHKKKKASAEAIKKRDAVIKEVEKLGRAQWKRQIGYHRRSLAETAMFRIKTLLGNRLQTRRFEHQKTEIAIWCRAINKMTALGMPETVAF